MQLSEISSPPDAHPLNRNFKVNGINNISIKPDKSKKTETKTAQPLLAIDCKPANPVMSTHMSKPQKTEAELKEEAKQKKKDMEIKNKKAEEEIAKTIIVDVDDNYDEKEIDDSDLLRFEFELTQIPSEDGKTMRTYLQNYKAFEELTDNKFELILHYMCARLKTSYGKSTFGAETIWFLEREFQSDYVELVKYNYINEILRCDKCNFFSSNILKNEDGELMRICCSHNCSRTEIIEYIPSGDDDEDTSRQCMLAEMSGCVDTYIPINVTYEKLPHKKVDKLDDKAVKQMEYMQKVLDGKIKPNVSSFGGYQKPYNNFNFNFNFNKFGIHHTPQYSYTPTNGVGRGSRPIGHSPHVPITIGGSAGTGNPSTGGYSVLNYSRRPSVPTSHGYVQSISQVKKHFGLSTVDDGREFYVYMDSKKDKFHSYVKYLIKLLNKRKEYKRKHPFSATDKFDDNWELSPTSLLRKAKELDILELAVMANVMYLFDENIIDQNQLINKRKFLLPFINNNTESAGLSFLLGIEYIINLDEEVLLSKADQILTIAYQQKYFDMETYNKWYKETNTEFIDEAFAKKIRFTLTGWKKSTEDDDSGSSVTSSSEDEADMDIEHETVAFDADLFGNMTADELKDMESLVDNTGPPSYVDSQKQKQYSTIKRRQISVEPFTAQDKTFALDNTSHKSLTLE